MKKTFLFLVSCFLFLVSAQAQTTDSLKIESGKITIIYPMTKKILAPSDVLNYYKGLQAEKQSMQNAVTQFKLRQDSLLRNITKWEQRMDSLGIVH